MAEVQTIKKATGTSVPTAGAIFHSGVKIVVFSLCLFMCCSLHDSDMKERQHKSEEAVFVGKGRVRKFLHFSC